VEKGPSLRDAGLPDRHASQAFADEPKNKLAHLESGEPELIATANIGCQLHLQTRARVPVRHWIELLDDSDDD
jgi:Fe-S oxidoreductase